MIESQNLNLQGVPNLCALEPLLIYHFPKLFNFFPPYIIAYRHDIVFQTNQKKHR